MVGASIVGHCFNRVFLLSLLLPSVQCFSPTSGILRKLNYSWPLFSLSFPFFLSPSVQCFSPIFIPICEKCSLNKLIFSYISAPPESCAYRAFRCQVKIAGGSTFMVNFKATDFQTSFRKCHETIMNKTYGRLVLNRPIENSVWTDFVPKLLFDVKDNIKHQRPAKNIGLQFDYLLERSFEHRGVLQLNDVEVVYPDVVYNGLGQVLEDPVHCVIDEAFPHKILVSSKFTASGLRGLLKLCLPPYTATSSMRRKQQQIAIIGAIGNIYLHICGRLRVLH